jgi:hypothetical protein
MIKEQINLMFNILFMAAEHEKPIKMTEDESSG